MNGGWVPTLGRSVRSRPAENVGVKKSTLPRSAGRIRGPRTGVPRTARAPQTGFTLIEVLVAMIVLVLGVLGAAAMTLNAIRDGKQSGLRSQASALAYEIGDLMRANRDTTSPAAQAAREAIFTAAAPGAGVGTCWTTGCSPADMAKNDYYEWHAKLQSATNGLPNGDAVICRDATKLADSFYPACDGLPTSPLVVKLKWNEKNNNARGATAPTSVTTRYLVVPIQPY